MESLSVYIIENLNNIAPVFQIFWMSLFAYLEGLPVVGSILPGGTIALLAGSISSTGSFSPLVAFLFIGISNFLGDMTGFLLGKKFKNNSFIKKLVEKESHQKNWDLFDRHIALISIFGKLIPLVRSVPSIFAAFRGIKTRRYITYSFIGSFLWSFAGVYFGNFLAQIFGSSAILIIFGILLISIALVVFNYLKKK
ncbi:MAG: VTT domain-containing protein [Candidatus Paceibacterota bacterium]